MAQLLSICTIEGAEKGFAVTKFLIKIISLDPLDMTVANHAYFAAMLSYTSLSAISRNGGRCEVLDVFFCDANIWSFIGVYGICIWALKDMIRLFFLCNCRSHGRYYIDCQNYYFSKYFPIQSIKVLIYFER